MSRKAKSIRGEVVDFDLIDIKNKIMNAPTPDTVQQRERFIDKRRRRGPRKKIDEMLAAQQVNESAVRAAIEEERRKRKADLTAQLDAQPHVVIEDTVVSAPVETPDATGKAPRRIVKNGG